MLLPTIIICVFLFVGGVRSSTVPNVSAGQMIQCRLPPQRGICAGAESATQKFYYHHDENTCKPLLYSGCGGNGNRFATVQECRDRCGATRHLAACRPPLLMESPDCVMKAIRKTENGCTAYVKHCPNKQPSGFCSPTTPSLPPTSVPEGCRMVRYTSVLGCSRPYVDCGDVVDENADTFEF